MKLELRNISRIVLFSLLILGVGTYAQASKVHFMPSKNTVIDARMLEENQKLINNVKVFYNPVSDEIAINFKLNKTNTVTIKVMDALGNEVLNLHNGSLEAGMQNLSFDTQQKLSEGFYFVRVSSGTETIVKRISVRQ
ncbi:MAG: T9SS type A sorting domain-containing protein [Sphingobacterium sp.]